MLFIFYPPISSTGRSALTSSPCSRSAVSNANVPIPREFPISGCRTGVKKHGVAPLSTKACTADLWASRGRIITLFRCTAAPWPSGRDPTPLPSLLPALPRKLGDAGNLCHWTQARIDAITPQVLVGGSLGKQAWRKKRAGQSRTVTLERIMFMHSGALYTSYPLSL